MPLSASDQSDLAAVLNGLADNRLTDRWRYYTGDHPRFYLTPKLQELFSELAERLVENYTGLAISTRVQRLEVTGWNGDGADFAQQTWDRGRWATRQNDLYRWALVHGRAYLIGWADGDQSVLSPASAAWTYGVPDDEDPTELELAGRVWVDGERWRATMFHDDGTVFRYVGRDVTRNHAQRPEWPKPDEFEWDPDEPYSVLPIDRCPVVPVTPYGSDAPPLLDQLAPIQDRINKLAANKFVAAEFAAFRQRVFFTRQDVQQGDLRQAPDFAIILDPGEPQAPTRVQELTASDLSNYDNAKQAEVNALFTIGALPRHLMVNPGTSPSGEAIKADESPLVEALHDHQREFGAALSRSLESLGGLPVEPTWREVEPRSDATTAQTVKTYVDAGLPWQTVVRAYAGWDDDAVAEAEAVIAAGAGQGEASLRGILTGLGSGAG